MIGLKKSLYNQYNHNIFRTYYKWLYQMYHVATQVKLWLLCGIQVCVAYLNKEMAILFIVDLN